jgi:uncharacterized protein YbjT (DUF2867 family)
MSTIKNVAIVGATGELGVAVLDRLIASKSFNITILKRQGSNAIYPAGVPVIEVDYTSFEAAKSALQGQDALVSTVGMPGVPTQTTLVDAAIAAGVKRFIPSEFGLNYADPKARLLPVADVKVKVEDYVIEKSKKSDLTYTFVYTGAFLDWGLRQNLIFNLAGGKTTIVESGDTRFSVITLDKVGDAVVGILRHPEETKNRAVHVHDTTVSQNQLLRLSRKAAPEREWVLVPVKLDDLTAVADERVKQGLFDLETFRPYLYRGLMDPTYGGDFAKTDNELLGLKEKTEEDVLQVIKGVLAEST